MSGSVFRLPATTVSQWLNRLTSAVTTRRRLSTAGSPVQIPLDRSETPIDGCDYKHWLVVMDTPTGYPTRNQIIESYIQTLATALGSEEVAKRSLYSVSTKYYYAFGCEIDENVVHSVKSMPNVRWILPDSYRCIGNNDYGGEPFTNGCAVPYDEIFHEDWLHDEGNGGFRRRARRRRSRRKEQKTDSN